MTSINTGNVTGKEGVEHFNKLSNVYIQCSIHRCMKRIIVTIGKCGLFICCSFKTFQMKTFCFHPVHNPKKPNTFIRISFRQQNALHYRPHFITLSTHFCHLVTKCVWVAKMHVHMTGY